jgi:hypothetical protein
MEYLNVATSDKFPSKYGEFPSKYGKIRKKKFPKEFLSR